MKISRILSIVFISFFIALSAYAANYSDQQVKREIVRQSINRYKGNCPCPYSLAANGSTCGKRSAYSRAGGYAPLCYEKDVTDQMVQEFRKN